MDGKTGVVRAAQVGGRIETVDGALGELRAAILRADKRQGKMLLSLDTKDLSMQAWLSCELMNLELDD